jgi:dihydrofolate reductase
MRKLKLQVQITTDGFVAGPKGQLDWMRQIDKDQPLIAFINELTDTSDTILLGRKMTPGFIAYWEGIIKKPDHPEYGFARKMVDMPKIAFSKTLQQMEGQNLRVENGDVVDAVTELKTQPGKDIVVYGGATFVSSLIQHHLIDELNLFVNPVAIGDGLRIFPGKQSLTLQRSTAYPSGVVVNTYSTK